MFCLPETSNIQNKLVENTFGFFAHESCFFRLYLVLVLLFVYGIRTKVSVLSSASSGRFSPRIRLEPEFSREIAVVLVQGFLQPDLFIMINSFPDSNCDTMLSFWKVGPLGSSVIKRQRKCSGPAFSTSRTTSHPVELLYVLQERPCNVQSRSLPYHAKFLKEGFLQTLMK